jgi:pimeloyl-ACP methyl ester carboxylesterase
LTNRIHNLSIHGKLPFQIGVVHGGPGAAGEMAPVARELSSNAGILEPLQTADSVDGQIQELQDVLKSSGDPPMILIGYSWGAWLCWMMGALYPELVKKLILISSGPFEERYAEGIRQTRMDRLSGKEREQIRSFEQQIDESGSDAGNELFEKIGSLIGKADANEPVTINSEEISYNLHIFQKVWPEADIIRKSGKLLELGKKIQCPIVAIHGDYDPHPAQGVREPLSRILNDFRFILLKKCGHKPWIEKWARDKFFKILKKELFI